MRKGKRIIIRRIFIYCLPFSFILSFHSAFGQLNEDFSSGSLTTNNWTGDTALFIVNTSLQLQLNDLNAGSSNLSTIKNSVVTGDSTQWSFNFSYDFSPSASNFAEFVLAADNPDLENYFGYYLKLGGISGADDAIELYRRDGSSSELLISGMIGKLGTSTVNAAVRCTRDSENNWTLELDENGGSNYSVEGFVTDDTYTIGNEIGIKCQYSSTRADKFFFDNINIGPAYVDDDPAQLLNFSIVNQNELAFDFNESLLSSSLDPENFVLDPNIGYSSINFTNVEESKITILLSGNLEDGQIYNLTLSGIEDLFSNQFIDTTLTFDFIKIESPNSNDILINEFMADPTPSVGLPEIEFIELYNRSDKNFQLGELTLADGNSEIPISNYILKKGEYVILFKDESTDVYASLVNKIPLSNFPTLGNSNDEITLYDNAGEIINSIEYDLSWYNDLNRNDGGYSIERIDPNRPCLEQNNWQASISNLGGTPGSANANLDLTIEEIPFAFAKISPVQSNVLSVVFNRSLNSNILGQIDLFEVEGFIPTGIVALSDQFNAFEISFDQSFEINTLYELCLNQGYVNCENIPVGTTICSNFGIPIQPQLGDILINELLPNPATGGSDFVEIINTTDNIFNLNNLFLAKLDSNGLPDQINPISNDFIMLPNDLVVLTENPADILARYTVPKPNNLIEMDLPTFDDKEGNVILMLSDFPTQIDLDQLDYFEDWHNPLLDIKDGVSLERISLIEETNNPANWRSASEQANFATPTGANSQSILVPEDVESPFFFDKKRLSPDDDGFEDFLAINYQEPSGDFLVNIKIYDIQGRLVKEVANNFSAGKQAFFRWDGDGIDGKKSRMGIYLLWMERFSGNGVVERFTEQIVLAEKLN